MIDTIKLIKYENLSALKHCFTTRTGGVSKGGQFSLNLSFTREKSFENVQENYRRVAEALEVDYNKMTRVPQTHTNHVLKITEELVGIGISKPFFSPSTLRVSPVLMNLYKKASPSNLCPSPTVAPIVSQSLGLTRKAYWAPKSNLYVSTSACCMKLNPSKEELVVPPSVKTCIITWS